MFVLAGLCLAFFPLMDSVARAGPPEPQPGTIMHFLRAFDVVDDVLDHVPGQPPAPAQAALQAPHAFPEPLLMQEPAASTVEPVRWILSSDQIPTSTQTGGLERPPRL